MCLKLFSLNLSSQENTQILAQTIAPLLKAEDILLLEGSIGAGKSFFARSLILSLLTKPEDIPSPTFTLVQTYDAPEFEIWHCDLYRLTTSYEAQELGMEDAFESALCIVEWPDRLGNITPPNALTIKFEITNTPHERLVTLCATNPRWASVLEVINDKP